MELLKSNPVIDKAYKPELKQDYINYFSRALKFGQTNYQDELTKASRVHFKSLSATTFLEEYAGAMLSTKLNIHEFEEYPKLIKSLAPYCHAFWDLNNFPTKDKMEGIFQKFNLSDEQFSSIHKTASIVSQGIRLFGWDRYRNNFLSSPGKLTALPGLGLTGAKVLSINIGGEYDPDSYQCLHNLALRFKFRHAEEMCKTLQKNFPMSIRTIGTILWYSTNTFEAP